MSDGADRVDPDPDPDPDPEAVAGTGTEPDERRGTDANPTGGGVDTASGDDSGAPADGPAVPDPESVGGGREPVVQRAISTAGDTTVIARTVARLVAPIVLLVAVALTVRGHNLPGGGFIGGVLTAIAFVLLYVVYSRAFVTDRLVPESEGRHPARLLFAVGLALAVVSGLGPVVLGGPFLTQGYVVFPHPIPGPFFHEFEVATALAFDLGVYLVVVGGLLTVVREVGAE